MVKKILTDKGHSLKAYAQRLINPIVSAAAPLLDAVVQPARVENAVDAQKVRQFLRNSVKNFESQLKENGYRASTILVSRHLICAFMDEMLLLQSWAKTYSWQDKSLSWHFAHKKLANEDFFMILESALKLSALNLDILELGYVCLSLGFQGKYRYTQDGQAMLAAFADSVYDAIRKQRGEHSRQLFVSIPATQKKRWFFQLPSKRKMLISAIIVFLVIMGSYHYRLSPLINSITQAMKTLQLNIQGVRERSSE